jgi:hypothetical protein
MMQNPANHRRHPTNIAIAVMDHIPWAMATWGFWTLSLSSAIPIRLGLEGCEIEELRS